MLRLDTNLFFDTFRLINEDTKSKISLICRGIKFQVSKSKSIEDRVKDLLFIIIKTNYPMFSNEYILKYINYVYKNLKYEEFCYINNLVSVRNI